ncbi:unnamed protein product [Somion occarium]|uniref:Uncharacterized protein n=1 Tax=Somion occarium TaxID=3059160 RepID=A0ABP1D7U5_9APHY
MATLSTPIIPLPTSTSETPPSTTEAPTESSSPPPTTTPPTETSTPPPTPPSSTPPASEPSSIPSSSPSSNLPPSDTTSSIEITSSSIPPSTTSSSSSSTITPPPSSTISSTSSTGSSTLPLSLSASTSGTAVVIVTVQQPLDPSGTPGDVSAQQNDTKPKSFFDNKGAVAGVFTVVGIIALVIIFALITNAVRRRKAKKFDRDVAEAAAEAAAQAHGAPGFDIDDDHEFAYRDPLGAQSNYTGYSGDSHGTYGQPPMAVPESYNMSEMHAYDPYAAAGVGSGVAGAAGVGAAGVNRARSVTTPYNAFAGPQVDPYAPDPSAQPQGMYDIPPQTPGQNLRYRQRGTSGGNELDLLDAAGLGGGAALAAGAAGGLARGPSHHLASTAMTTSPASLARNKSLGSQTLGGSSSGDHESYAAHYQPGFKAETYQPPAAQTQAQTQQYLSSSSRPVSTEDPYGGIDTSPTSTEMPNPFSPPAHGQPSDPRPLSGNYSSPDGSDQDDGGPHGFGYHDGADSRASLRDEEDYAYGGGRRVLKVANE